MLHVIMGPMSRKSILANCIFNNPEYIKTSGEIDLKEKNINISFTDKIAKKEFLCSFNHLLKYLGFLVQTLNSKK